MRIPRDSGLDPQVIASIKRHRRRASAIRLAAALPLIAGVAAALAACLVKVVGGGGVAESSAGSWVALAALTAVLIIVFSCIKPERMPQAQPRNEHPLGTFVQALEGVCVAVGLEPPRLLVLDLPTANSLSLYHENKPAVGITAEALEAALPRHVAEAMMAHETAHMLLGDVVLGRNTRRWRKTVLALVTAMVLPFALLALAFGFGAWTYLGLLGWIAFSLVVIWVLGSRVFRQNDLLADSVAAKITSDPGALKEAIRLLDGMFLSSEKPFPPGARYPSLFFVSEKREGDDIATLPGLTEERLANLEAIELGRWPAFER